MSDHTSCIPLDPITLKLIDRGAGQNHGTIKYKIQVDQVDLHR